jgi:hypothetical protein
MFTKKKTSPVAISSGNSETGNRFGGTGFTDFIHSLNGIEKWKPSVGVNKIDVIPYNASKSHPFVVTGQVEEGDCFYSLELFVHKNVGPSRSSYVCLKQFGKRCPLCEEGLRLRGLGTEAGDAGAKALYASRRIIYIVHDLINNKYGYWDTGFKSVQQKIAALSQFEVENGSKIDVFDWEEGRTIQFIGTEKVFNGSKYVEPDGFNFAKRQPLSDEVLSHSIDPSTMINISDEASLEKLLAGDFSTATPSVSETVSQPSVQSAPVAQSPAPEVPSKTIDDAVSEEMSKPVQPAPVASEAPVQPAPVAAQAQAPQGSHVCPHGYQWGTADSHPECSKCNPKIWEDCIG